MSLLSSIAEGSCLSLNAIGKHSQIKALQSEVNTGSIFISVFEGAFSIDRSATESEEEGEEEEKEDNEGDEGDEGGESKLLGVGPSRDTKSDNSAFTMLDEVECQEPREEARLKTYLSDSMVDMLE